MIHPFGVPASAGPSRVQAELQTRKVTRATFRPHQRPLCLRHSGFSTAGDPRFETLKPRAAGLATTRSVPPKRAAAIPSPGGLPLLGKQRKEFAAAKALGAERAGASESLGQGEGGLPSTQYIPAPCSRRFLGRAGFPPSNTARPVFAVGSRKATLPSSRRIFEPLDLQRHDSGSQNAPPLSPLLGGEGQGEGGLPSHQNRTSESRPRFMRRSASKFGCALRP